MDRFNGARIPIWVKWQFVRVSYLVGNQSKATPPLPPVFRQEPSCIPPRPGMKFNLAFLSLRCFYREKKVVVCREENSKPPGNGHLARGQVSQAAYGSASLKSLNLPLIHVSVLDQCVCVEWLTIELMFWPTHIWVSIKDSNRLLSYRFVELLFSFPPCIFLLPSSQSLKS